MYKHQIHIIHTNTYTYNQSLIVVVGFGVLRVVEGLEATLCEFAGLAGMLHVVKSPKEWGRVVMGVVAPAGEVPLICTVVPPCDIWLCGVDLGESAT